MRIEFPGCVRNPAEHVECVHARAEEIGRQKELREQCDVVVARAVARLPVLLEYCLPLVSCRAGFTKAEKPQRNGRGAKRR